MRYLAVLLLLLSASRASAQTPTLLWDANPPTESISGYQVLSGPTSGTYTTTVSVGNVTSYVLPPMTVPTYLAVKAVGTNGLMSPPSAEVVYTPGCFNGKVISPLHTLWTFTVKPNTKAMYTTYVVGLGGWTLLQSRSSSGGNWLLQFRCDR